MVSSSLFVLGILCLNIVLTEWLVRNTPLRHLGTSLLVILITAITSNLGIIPTNATEAPIYDAIFKYVAPFAIFLPLLQVILKTILKAGLPMIGTFLIGSLGTAIGVAVADVGGGWRGSAG